MRGSESRQQELSYHAAFQPDELSTDPAAVIGKMPLQSLRNSITAMVASRQSYVTLAVLLMIDSRLLDVQRSLPEQTFFDHGFC